MAEFVLLLQEGLDHEVFVLLGTADGAVAKPAEVLPLLCRCRAMKDVECKPLATFSKKIDSSHAGR